MRQAYFGFLLACGILVTILAPVSPTSGENFTVTPDKGFIQGNDSVKLTYRLSSEKILTEYFKGNFDFFHNGEPIMAEGGGATNAYEGKPYVDYIIKNIKEEGNYTGTVENLTAESLIYKIRGEENGNMARRGTNLTLSCELGPARKVKMWEVDGVHVDRLVGKKFRKNSNGSLTVFDIEFDDANRVIVCRLFFNLQDKKSYEANKTGIPVYRTASVKFPISAFETVKTRESTTYVLKTKALKNGRIDYSENGTRLSKVLYMDETLKLQMNSSCVIHFRNSSTDCSYAEDQGAHPDQSDNSANVPMIVGIIVPVVIVVVAFVGIYFIRKRTRNSTDGGENDGAGEVNYKNE